MEREKGGRKTKMSLKLYQKPVHTHTRIYINMQCSVLYVAKIEAAKGRFRKNKPYL